MMKQSDSKINYTFVKIKKKEPKMRIIAESAFNHNGDKQNLMDLALKSKHSGADLFTVQIYRTDNFCTKSYSKYGICKNTEISEQGWKDLFSFCKEYDIKLIPCVLDDFSLDLVLKKEYKLIKIHATDLLNLPFLKRVSQEDVKVLLETQCATKRDIQIAIDILGSNIEALFHGFSNYPTENEDLNLDALDHIRQLWPQYKIGFADHTLDTKGIPLMVLAKKADYLEKHITLSRNNRNFDWQVSLEPEEFRIMVEQVRKYQKTLGKGFKHPVESETSYRHIMYKKYVPNQNGVEVLRSDDGLDFYEYMLQKHNPNKVIGCIIARLKSNRLPKKVFKHFHNDLLVFDLIRRVSSANYVDKVILATSYLDEDKPLITEAENRNIEAYPGDPLSVIDRMLDLAEKEKAGAVFRITGDNPFTEPYLLDRMVEIYLEKDLDYVRVNNLPFGITAELYSVKYLQKLYYTLENPYQTEYLTWFVILDKTGRKGCIDFIYPNPDIKRIGYSVDYPEDYERCLKVLDKIGKEDFTDVNLKDIIENSVYENLIDFNSELKLPQGKSMTFEAYFDMLDKMDYEVRIPLSFDELIENQR